MGVDDALRVAQVEAMSSPARVQVLSLVLNNPRGEVTVETLVGPRIDPATVQSHLDVLVEVGLLDRADDRYVPTHDALARFGSLAGHDSVRPEQDFGDHDRLLGWIVEDLTGRYAGLLAPETVREFVVESYDLLAARAKVRIHLPQLTYRFAAGRLQAVASVSSDDPRMRDDVLFVCVKNAGRSQIAAALMRARAGELIRVRTAGSAPSARLDPIVRAELARLGVEGLTEFPRPLTNEVVRASGVVVTMGCGDACPVVPGRRYVDWQVADPVGRPAWEVRRIVGEISDRVNALIVELRIDVRA
jgi:protein-tyrosine-phosphatase/DNA-binding transcriptional ArsR family regulator